MAKKRKGTRYEYFINLDERGEFYADLRDELGNTVWELHTEDARSLVEDGFLRAVRDPDAIEYYLREAGIIDADAIVLKGD